MVKGLDRDDHVDSLANSLSTRSTKAGKGPSDDERVGGEGRERGRSGGSDDPAKLAAYYKNAPVRRLKHPLEENIFSSLFITLFAVAVAILVGIPVLIVVGAVLIVVLLFRYSSVMLVDCCSYVRFICSNRSVPTRPPPQIFSSDHLACANDVRWLGKKSPQRCQSILHTILVFEGSMDILSLRHLVQSRVLHAETPEGELSYPRLIQKVVPLVTGYRWELDVQFDIQNHIFHGPSNIRTESQVQKYLGILLLESLPMGKPLWEIRVLPNYGAQKDTFLILRVHQCLADGMTLVRILSHSLADFQQMHIPQRPHFAGLSFGFNVLRSLIVGPLTFFLWYFMTFRDINLFSKPLPTPTKKAQCSPKDTTTKAATTTNTTVTTSKSTSTSKSSHNKKSSSNTNTDTSFHDVENPSQRGASSHPDPIKSSSGLWKVLWSASMTVPKVARVKQIMRSSFNDVLLSAAAGSVRTYLQNQGIPYPDDVKVIIPVDLRNDIASPKSSTKLGCKVASILATIPSGIESAIPRLWRTRRALDELKASADPVVAYGATAVLMNVLPHPLGTSVLDSLTNKASFQFCNLPGPSSTLVVGGFPLKGVYPIYPPSGKIRVAVSVFTYADQVHVTVVAHRSLRNACPSLLHEMTNQVDQLSRQLSQRRVPGESRRSARHMSTNNMEITKPPTRQIHIQLQVVQEELQQLSHRLDCSDEQSDVFPSDEPLSLQLSPGGHSELRTRLKTLKNEFTELIGELRRRSSIVEGVTISFEDEEMEDEFRKPRKRALSVVSVTRRNSIFSARSLTTPDSSQCYSSDEDLSSSATPPPDMRMYSPNLLHTSPSIRTTAV